MTVAIAELPRADREAEKRWDTYVLGHAHASGYHATGWRRVVERVYGHRTRYLFAEEDGQIVGVLPLAQIKFPLLRNVVTSLPFTTYGGIVADSPAVSRRLLEAGTDVARTMGARSLELRHYGAAPVELPARTHKVTMWLDLPSAEDALWKTFRTDLRTDIRRRIKDGLEVGIGGTEELDHFYGVYAVNMRDLGTPVYPRAFFATILEEWPGSAWIATCAFRGETVASGMLLGFRGSLEIPWASSLKTMKGLRPNMLLYWECLRHAIAMGFDRFDFGRSTPHGGTFGFKKQWGARPVPLFWQYWMADPAAALPDLNPDNRRFAVAIRMWQRLPLGVTRLIGPPIVRYLP
jgi:FemAB-related protein (PEP-CTERM system-associated)